LDEKESVDEHMDERSECGIGLGAQLRGRASKASNCRDHAGRSSPDDALLDYRVDGAALTQEKEASLGRVRGWDHTVNGMGAIISGSDTSEGREAARTILVVDDNRDMVDSIGKVLELLGYSAIPAYSAREACDLLDEAPNIDLVLSDVRMPEMDGFDLLRVLRHRFRSLPIILMSGLAVTPDDIVPSGAAILQKPIDMRELQRLVEQKIGRKADL
jgi:CheY-like chemotaxis protein